VVVVRVQEVRVLRSGAVTVRDLPQAAGGGSWITAVIHEKHGRVVAAGWSGEAPKATGASLMDVHAYPPNVS
jgi:hypothetical protein